MREEQSVKYLVMGALAGDQGRFGAVPLRAIAEYRDSDPYAVVLQLRSSGRWVPWQFDRSLLANALDGPIATEDEPWAQDVADDVRLRREVNLVERRGESLALDEVRLDVCSPEGSATLWFPVVDLERFRQAAAELVEEGAEEPRFVAELDDELEQILSGSPDRDSWD